MTKSRFKHGTVLTHYPILPETLLKNMAKKKAQMLNMPEE